jgi:hypothetical protein
MLSQWFTLIFFKTIHDTFLITWYYKKLLLSRTITIWSYLYSRKPLDYSRVFQRLLQANLSLPNRYFFFSLRCLSSFQKQMVFKLSLKFICLIHLIKRSSRCFLQSKNFKLELHLIWDLVSQFSISLIKTEEDNPSFYFECFFNRWE